MSKRKKRKPAAHNRPNPTKPTQKKVRKWWLPVVLIALAVIACLYLYAPLPGGNGESERAWANMRQVGKQYMARHRQPDAYWLKQSKPDAENCRMVTDFRNRLRSALYRYRSANDLSMKIARQYRSYSVTQYVDGKGLASRNCPAVKPGEGKVNIAVFSQQQAAKHRQLHTRSHGEGSTLLAAIDFPEAVLAAMVYHELGHEYFRNVLKAKSATAERYTSLFNKEEAVMHELEFDVLNDATDGKLAALFSDIAQRARSSNPYDVLAAVRSEELSRFDELLETTDMGKRAAGNLLMMFWHDLAIYAVNQNPEQADKAAGKAEVYGAITLRNKQGWK